MVAGIAATALLAIGATGALADYGTYNTNDGPSCSYSGSGSMYTFDCSGYSRSAGGYVRYSCDYTVYGSSASWSCRDSNGATWRGSR